MVSSVHVSPLPRRSLIAQRWTVKSRILNKEVRCFAIGEGDRANQQSTLNMGLLTPHLPSVCQTCHDYTEIVDMIRSGGMTENTRALLHSTLYVEGC